MKVVSDADCTCDERKECDKQSRDLFRPRYSAVEAETKDDVDENSTQHDYERELCKPEDDAVTPVVDTYDVLTNGSLTVLVFRFVDNEPVI